MKIKRNQFKNKGCVRILVLHKNHQLQREKKKMMRKKKKGWMKHQKQQLSNQEKSLPK